MKGRAFNQGSKEISKQITLFFFFQHQEATLLGKEDGLTKGGTSAS